MSLLQELLFISEAQTFKPTIFQVRVSNGDYEDRSLHFQNLKDVQERVDDEGDVSELTGLVEEYIGKGPNSRGSNRGSWDEMEFEIESFKDEVLKIKYTFSGVDMGRLEGKSGTPVTKKGVITLMPGN